MDLCEKLITSRGYSNVLFEISAEFLSWFGIMNYIKVRVYFHDPYKCQKADDFNEKLKSEWSSCYWANDASHRGRKNVLNLFLKLKKKPCSSLN